MRLNRILMHLRNLHSSQAIPPVPVPLQAGALCCCIAILLSTSCVGPPSRPVETNGRMAVHLPSLPATLGANCMLHRDMLGKSSPSNYATALGSLRRAYTYRGSFSVRWDGQKMNPSWDGVVQIAPQEGYEVTGGFLGLAEGCQSGSTKVTLVQDAKTGRWLATDGYLATSIDRDAAIEGETITIVGGANAPIQIAGQPFADTTLIIQGGVPVRKSAETGGPVSSAPSNRIDVNAASAVPFNGKHWPPYLGRLSGIHRVRVTNPNDFAVKVGIRALVQPAPTLVFSSAAQSIAYWKEFIKPFHISPGFTGDCSDSLIRQSTLIDTNTLPAVIAAGGADFVVPPNSSSSVSVPKGTFNLYFEYSNEPNGLYQGDPIKVGEDNSPSFGQSVHEITITIMKVPDGNYRIQKLR